MDSKPHTINVDGKPVVIEANQTWRQPAKITVSYNSREVHINENEEFAIWNNTDFGPQKRAPARGGSPLR